MKSSLRMFIATATLLLISSSPALGQAVTGSIVGSVTDASGAAIAGAKVTITETSTGVARATTTNAEGGYVLPYLSPGAYKVEIEKAGFKKSALNEVQLATGQAARVNATLEVGQLTETTEI